RGRPRSVAGSLAAVRGDRILRGVRLGDLGSRGRSLGGGRGRGLVGSRGRSVRGRSLGGAPLGAVTARGRVGGRTRGGALRSRRGLVDLDLELVDDHAAAARDLPVIALPAGLRVRSAAVVEMDHAAVGRGPFVRAHAELVTERSGQLGEEPAAGAVRRNSAAATAPGLLARAEVALEPALRGLAAALRGEHAGTAQAELPQRDAVLVLVAGGLVALLEPLVLLPIGQQVVG